MMRKKLCKRVYEWWLCRNLNCSASFRMLDLTKRLLFCLLGYWNQHCLMPLFPYRRISIIRKLLSPKSDLCLQLTASIMSILFPLKIQNHQKMMGYNENSFWNKIIIVSLSTRKNLGPSRLFWNLERGQKLQYEPQKNNNA